MLCRPRSVMDVCSRCGSLLAPTRVPAPAAAALAGHPALQAHDAAGAPGMHAREHACTKTKAPAGHWQHLVDNIE